MDVSVRSDNESMSNLSEIREAFADISEAPPEQRAGLLANLPEDLRAEVQSLLASHQEAGWFLLPLDSESLPAGTAVGPYLIVEPLGQGGMGVVYRARRADGEFEREVALKFVSGLPMAAEAERRFIAERRILAALDHPNIVRMLDGGVWRRRRYLAMELVSGEPLTEYCERNQLPLPARLRLFQQVCAAIQYAHQRLIVHRDIKSGNIFVTAEGQVKALDFGVARILASDAEDAVSTLFQPMTLSCASPEQIRGEPLTLASDIYSLGLLLRELLTGLKPPGNALADLDAVAAKAAAPLPQDRYDSAAALSDEIDRLLLKQPVLARAPSTLYHTKLFIARHRGQAVLVSLLLLGIIGGACVSFWQARRAEQQRNIAEQRFAVGRRLLYSMIHEIQPEMGKLNGSLPLRAQMLEKLLRYMEELRKDAADSPPLLRDLIDGYVEMAGVAGSMAQANVGASARKWELLQEAQALAAKLEPSAGASPESLQTLGRLERAIAQEDILRGKQQSATEHARRALTYANRAAGLLPGNEAAQSEVATANMKLGDVLPDKLEAVACFERAVAIWQEQLGKTGDGHELSFRIANVFRNLSTIYLDRKDTKRAAEYALRARDLDQAALNSGNKAPAVQLALAFDLGAAGAAYIRMGQLQSGADQWHRSVAIRREVADANPDDHRAADRLAYALAEWSEAEYRLGQNVPARSGFIEAIAIYQRLARSAPLNRQSAFQLAYSNYYMGQLEQRQGNAQQACHWYSRAKNVPLPIEKGSPLLEIDARFLEALSAAMRKCVN